MLNCGTYLARTNRGKGGGQHSKCLAFTMEAFPSRRLLGMAVVLLATLAVVCALDDGLRSGGGHAIDEGDEDKIKFVESNAAVDMKKTIAVEGSADANVAVSASEGVVLGDRASVFVQVGDGGDSRSVEGGDGTAIKPVSNEDKLEKEELDEDLEPAESPGEGGDEPEAVATDKPSAEGATISVNEGSHADEGDAANTDHSVAGELIDDAAGSAESLLGGEGYVAGTEGAVGSVKISLLGSSAEASSEPPSDDPAEAHVHNIDNTASGEESGPVPSAPDAGEDPQGATGDQDGHEPIPPQDEFADSSEHGDEIDKGGATGRKDTPPTTTDSVEPILIPDDEEHIDDTARLHVGTSSHHHANAKVKVHNYKAGDANEAHAGKLKSVVSTRLPADLDISEALSSTATGTSAMQGLLGIFPIIQSLLLVFFSLVSMILILWFRFKDVISAVHGSKGRLFFETPKSIIDDWSGMPGAHCKPGKKNKGKLAQKLKSIEKMSELKPPLFGPSFGAGGGHSASQTSQKAKMPPSPRNKEESQSEPPSSGGKATKKKSKRKKKKKGKENGDLRGTIPFLVGRLPVSGKDDLSQVYSPSTY